MLVIFLEGKKGFLCDGLQEVIYSINISCMTFMLFVTYKMQSLRGEQRYSLLWETSMIKHRPPYKLINSPGSIPFEKSESHSLWIP